MTAKANFVFAVDLILCNHTIKLPLPNKSCWRSCAVGWCACWQGNTVVVAQQYPGIKCIIDGNQQCRIEHSIEFNWDQKSVDKKCLGKIFFSSQHAAKRFQARVVDKLKLDQQPDSSLLLKANHQLTLTGQVEQQRCPLTGKSIAPEHQLLIAGVKVCFHDAAAKNKVELLETTWHRAERVLSLIHI